MNIREGWTLAEVANEYVAVPVGDNAAEFKGVVKLNKTGRDIWNGLAEGMNEEEIAFKMVQEYEELSIEKALEGVRKVVDILVNQGLLEK